MKTDGIDDLDVIIFEEEWDAEDDVLVNGTDCVELNGLVLKYSESDESVVAAADEVLFKDTDSGSAVLADKRVNIVEANDADLLFAVLIVNGVDEKLTLVEVDIILVDVKTDGDVERRLEGFEVAVDEAENETVCIGTLVGNVVAK